MIGRWPWVVASSVCVLPFAAQAAAAEPMGGARHPEDGRQTAQAAENPASPVDPNVAPSGTTAPAEPPQTPPGATAPGSPPPAAATPWWAEGWHTEITGYFRAPISLGISSRPGPDELKTNGPSHLQVSYGPNRTIDSSYFSFAYTRLQEQDWAEAFIHEKRKHVDVALGWMGFWFQGVGFRNSDAAWVPGLAYLALDTDFDFAGWKPNVMLTTGAWWPKFGYFEKYDTYTLGRFRQIGTQVKLTVPFNPDFTLTLTGGFGTNRDGTFTPPPLAPPFFGSHVALDLLDYWNAEFNINNYADINLHYNTEWTADPNFFNQDMVGEKSYINASQAHLTVAGLELNLRAPRLGHLWVSPSIINVKNGWALGSAGTEVMHGLGGAGVATNYLALSNSLGDSTGSGTIYNLGFMYENSLSRLRAREPGSFFPDLTVSAFGLLADASLDLTPQPAGHQSLVNQSSIKQFKYGADATLQATPWLGVMVRGDLVNYDLDHPGFVFAAITAPRLIFSSHFLSGERIFIQFAHYFYGDKMVLAALWPWNVPLVAGADVLQQGPYAGQKPDENVVTLQADVSF
ncbi:MAG: hypothetical protein JOZ69_20135 [Myxococcales bacterium]|nr:hypothetical protein [Myxococcales bacterium]